MLINLDEKYLSMFNLNYIFVAANRLEHLKMQEHIPMEAMKQFFDAKKCTPDLSELFQGIDKNRLKRTSSAIWKTPPRFSRMDEFN